MPRFSSVDSSMQVRSGASSHDPLSRVNRCFAPCLTKPIRLLAWIKLSQKRARFLCRESSRWSALWERRLCRFRLWQAHEPVETDAARPRAHDLPLFRREHDGAFRAWPGRDCDIFFVRRVAWRVGSRLDLIAPAGLICGRVRRDDATHFRRRCRGRVGPLAPSQMVS